MPRFITLLKKPHSLLFGVFFMSKINAPDSQSLAKKLKNNSKKVKPFSWHTSLYKCKTIEKHLKLKKMKNKIEIIEELYEMIENDYQMGLPPHESWEVIEETFLEEDQELANKLFDKVFDLWEKENPTWKSDFYGEEDEDEE